jgi:hypothetical protein
VACPGLVQAEVGLYSSQPSTFPVWLTRPWEVVMPSDSWGAVRAWWPDGASLWQATFDDGRGWLVFISPAGRRADLALLAAAAGLLTFQVFYWADGIMYGPRYLYAALPSFVLLTARSFLRLAQYSGQRATGLLLLALVGGNLIFFLPGQFDERRGYNFVDRSALDLAEAEAAAPAIVLVDPGAGDWWAYGRVFSANTPWLDGPIVYARDLGQAENGRLLATMPERRGYLLRPGGLQPIPDN